MGIHGSAGSFNVAIGDGLHETLMLEEAVMIGRRALGGIAQPSPDNRPSHGVQRVEQREQERVARGSGDQPVEPVVAILIMAPAARLA